MTGQVLTNVLLALIAVAVPVVAYLNGARANKVQAEAERIKAEIQRDGADAQAFVTAKSLYEGVIGSLREQVGRLERSNERLEHEVAGVRQANMQLAEEVALLKRSNAQLQREVELLNGR